MVPFHLKFVTFIFTDFSPENTISSWLFLMFQPNILLNKSRQFVLKKVISVAKIMSCLYKSLFSIEVDICVRFKSLKTAILQYVL